MGHIGSVGRTVVCNELDWIWTEEVVVPFLIYYLRIYMELVKKATKISARWPASGSGVKYVIS